MEESGPGVLKDRFTALDTLALCRELRGLAGSRVDKVFDREGGWTIVLRAAGEGRRELAVVPGRYAYLSDRSEPSEGLTPLAKDLRRLLTGGRLKPPADPGGERYLELEFLAAAADPPFLLAVELFGKGNLLVARAGRILAVQHTKTWSKRAVRIGAEYARPPARADPWKSSAAEIEAVLVASRTDRATTLAARLAFGGPVAEELLTRAALAGSVSAPTDAPEAARGLAAAVGELFREVGEAPKGYLYRRGELPIDVEPVPSHRLRGSPGVTEQEFPAFSEAARIYFEALPKGEAVLPPAVRAGEEARRELERQRARQEVAIRELAAEAEERRRDADALLQNFGEAESARGRRTGDPEGPRITEIEVSGRRILVRLDAPLRVSAQALYEEARKLRLKLEGARAALAESDRRIAEGAVASARRADDLPRPAPSRRHWFERHRWFLSSEGAIVIGGRDAASNDLIVRRYLKPEDRYVHADIHGAPSVIVKHPAPGSPPLSDATMEEAGQWGVAFSRAWRAGLASASAFWVEADQVSKAGASGEFVARGAWVIHGTKHLMKDLATELAIGTVRYEGAETWMVAPPRAFARSGQARFLLGPGEERERAERESALAKELGLSRARLQPLLPSGGLTFRRA